jgi:amino acid adenylation domain-containing protein
VGSHILAKVHYEESRTVGLREAGDPSAFAPEVELWNTGQRQIDPWNTTVLDLFRDAVRRAPDAPAISDAHESISYRSLWNFAAGFRARLIAQGIEPGDMVAIAAKRSIATIAAILGVTMAGGCYVPIDLEEFSASILRRLAERAGLRRWIADADARRSAGSVIWMGSPVVALEDISCPAGGDLAEIPAVAITPDSPLYVMFTSGSTGLPKGVLVPHRAVVRLVTGQNFIDFGPEHTFLLHSPLSFDASTLELWGSLLHGSRLVVAPDRRLGLDDYAQLLNQQRVTTLWLTAAMFHLAAAHAPEMFTPLSQLLFGGDVIAPRDVERIRIRYPALHMVNGYGPTENTTFTCCYTVPVDYRADGALPIGTPIFHTSIHVLDSDGREVAVGQEGELATGGAGVALGYLGHPELTAERFVPDTFSKEHDAMLYLTGDRVRQIKDGTLEFLGRLDSQVKIAGHRVELGAIESSILSSPLVDDAAVLVLTRLSGEKQLVACLSLQRPTKDAEPQLRGWLRVRLSRASIPQHWIFFEHLPININGKLDRNALRSKCEALLLTSVPSSSQAASPAIQQVNAAGGELLDASEIMSYLQQLWASLIGRPSVGIDETFFDIGGTSVLLIEMHARLKTQFAATPSLVDMFAFPTPRLLAARLLTGREAGTQSQQSEQRGQRQRTAMLARRSTPVKSGADGAQ